MLKWATEHDILLLCHYIHLFHSRSFVTLLVWSIQVSVNSTPRRKDVRSYLREAIVAACESRKVIGPFANNLEFIILHSFTSGKHSFKTFSPPQMLTASPLDVPLPLHLCRQSQAQWLFSPETYKNGAFSPPPAPALATRSCSPATVSELIPSPQKKRRWGTLTPSLSHHSHHVASRQLMEPDFSAGFLMFFMCIFGSNLITPGEKKGYISNLTWWFLLLSH